MDDTHLQHYRRALQGPCRTTLPKIIAGMFLSLTLAVETASSQEIEDMVLLERLREGGLVIIFRHGQSNREQTDQLELASAGDLTVGQRQSMFLDCSRQRTLSDTGRDELAQIAQAMRTMELAVDDVEASPMCRTRETAWLIFGRVTPNPMLVSRRELDGRRQLAGTIPPAGTNHVLVSHGQLVAGVVQAAENPSEEPIPEGGAFVLEPLGDSRYRVLARLLAADWYRLAELTE